MASNSYYSSRVPPGHGRPEGGIVVNPGFQFFEIRERFLSPRECAEVVRLGEAGALYPYFSRYGPAGDAGNIDEAHENHVAREIVHGEDSEWLYRRVWDLIQGANDKIFRFRISELSTALVLRTYEPGASVKWHFDNVKGGEKIGFVVQLSDASDYDGGDLIAAIGLGERFLAAPRGQGTAFLFPTFVCHSVTKVTRGVRRTLVGWMLGDTFV